MLTAAQFDNLVVPIVGLYDEYSTTIIKDIARRLTRMDMTSAAAWQVQRLIESGRVYREVLAELSKLTGKSQRELERLFKRAGVKAMAFDDRIYRAAGLNPLPLNLSPAMTSALLAGLRKTNGLVNNLTLSTAFTSQQSFLRAADVAYLQVSTGAMSYDQAIRAAIKKVAADGLEVLYPSGHVDKLEVAMRRAVLTGVGQTAAQLQLTRAEEMGVDLIAVSAHLGARSVGEGPANHESWQGKVYSRSGRDSRYPDFVAVTGYGTGAGLSGWNCRHSFYPFFDGISQAFYDQAALDEFADKRVIYNGKPISIYEATQVQRGIERRIRYWKRQAAALEADKAGNFAELAKVKEYQARMRDFISQMNEQQDFIWYRQRVREQI